MREKIGGRGGNYGAEMNDVLSLVIEECYKRQPHNRGNASTIGGVRK